MKGEFLNETTTLQVHIAKNVFLFATTPCCFTNSGSPCLGDIYLAPDGFFAVIRICHWYRLALSSESNKEALKASEIEYCVSNTSFASSKRNLFPLDLATVLVLTDSTILNFWLSQIGWYVFWPKTNRPSCSAWLKLELAKDSILQLKIILLYRKKTIKEYRNDIQTIWFEELLKRTQINQWRSNLQPRWRNLSANHPRNYNVFQLPLWRRTSIVPRCFKTGACVSSLLIFKAL